MELSVFLRAIRQWGWLILLLVVISAAAMLVSLNRAVPTYEGQVKLQLTAPQEEDVAVYNQYRSVSLRDEMTVARNNFSEVLQSQVVRDRTAAQLNLRGDDTQYGLDVKMLRDADFTYVTVTARTPELAQKIANAHVKTAIAYYGEIRAKPADATRDFLAQQLRSGQQQLGSAREELAKFQMENGILSPENAVASSQKLIEQLQTQQDQWTGGGTTMVAIQQTESLLNQLKLERERVNALGDDPTQRTNVKNQLLQLDEAIARYTVQLDDLRNASPTGKEIQAIQQIVLQLKLDRERLNIEGDTTKDKLANLDRAIVGYAQQFDNLQKSMPSSNAAVLTGAMLNDLRSQRDALNGQGDQTVKERLVRIDQTIASYTAQLEALRGTQPTSEAIDMTTNILGQLKADRANLSPQGSTAQERTARLDEAIARYTADLKKLKTTPLPATAPASLDDTVAKRTLELQRVLGLGPRYALLQDNVNQAASQFALIQGKYNEAVLKAATARAASYIQVVEPAAAPAEPVQGKERILLLLAILGSLSLGVLAALALDYVKRSGMRFPSASPGMASSRRGSEAGEERKPATAPKSATS